MSDIETYRISGSPDPEQERTILAALERMLREETQNESRWKLAARGRALGAGAADLRSKALGGWALVSTLGWQGGGPQDLRGRGDAK